MGADAHDRTTARWPEHVVVNGLTKTSDKIRALFSAGYERVELHVVSDAVEVRRVREPAGPTYSFARSPPRMFTRA